MGLDPLTIASSVSARCSRVETATRSDRSKTLGTVLRSSLSVVSARCTAAVFLFRWPMLRAFVSSRQTLRICFAWYCEPAQSESPNGHLKARNGHRYQYGLEIARPDSLPASHRNARSHEIVAQYLSRRSSGNGNFWDSGNDQRDFAKCCIRAIRSCRECAAAFVSCLQQDIRTIAYALRVTGQKSRLACVRNRIDSANGFSNRGGMLREARRAVRSEYRSGLTASALTQL